MPIFLENSKDLRYYTYVFKGARDRSFIVVLEEHEYRKDQKRFNGIYE